MRAARLPFHNACSASCIKGRSQSVLSCCVNGTKIAVGIELGRSPRLGMQQQGQQTLCLGVDRLEVRHQAGQEDSLLAQRRVSLGRRCGEFAADRVSGVDGVEHSGQALGQFIRLGSLEGQAGFADACLYTNQSLRHGAGCDEEGPRDGSGLETQHRLQHQRRMVPGRQRGVSAGQHQLQAPVGNALQRIGSGGLVAALAAAFIEERQHLGCLRQLVMAMLLQQHPPGRRHQPAFGRGRHAVAWPVRQRGDHGLGQRVLCGGQVMPLPGQIGHQPSVGVARGAVRPPASRWACCCVSQSRLPESGIGGSTGRISVWPAAELGARAAHSSACSIDGTSTMK